MKPNLLGIYCIKLPKWLLKQTELECLPSFGIETKLSMVRTVACRSVLESELAGHQRSRDSEHLAPAEVHEQSMAPVSAPDTLNYNNRNLDDQTN